MPDWMDIEKDIRKKGRLKVIPMQGWKRSMLWPETGLEWVATSPYIPSFSFVLGYAMTGLGACEGNFSHGIGTPYPFRLLTHKQLTSNALLKRLQALDIDGLDYKIIRTRDVKGNPVSGVYVGINNWKALKPTELSFYMMQNVIDLEKPNPFKTTTRSNLFNKHVGKRTKGGFILIRTVEQNLRAMKPAEMGATKSYGKRIEKLLNLQLILQ